VPLPAAIMATSIARAAPVRAESLELVGTDIFFALTVETMGTRIISDSVPS
jgi:hypothetical protein